MSYLKSVDITEAVATLRQASVEVSRPQRRVYTFSDGGTWEHPERCPSCNVRADGKTPHQDNCPVEAAGVFAWSLMSLLCFWPCKRCSRHRGTSPFEFCFSCIREGEGAAAMLKWALEWGAYVQARLDGYARKPAQRTYTFTNRKQRRSMGKRGVKARTESAKL